MVTKIVYSEKHQLPKSMINGESAFNEFMSLRGESYRKVARRETLKVEIDGHSYFIKKHFGVGWKEIIKNLLSFKLPIISAKNEWDAIKKMQEIGISTTPFVAYGARGIFPATKQSFLFTEDLGDIVTLEDLCKDWLLLPPAPAFKRLLITDVAKLARLFHAHGMWHRDFYLCHFALNKASLLRGDWQLYLMDLHRVEIYQTLPLRKRLKDLAGLYFSALHIGLTHRDILRFLATYYQKPLREVMQGQQTVLQIMADRALKLDKKLQRKIEAGVVL